MTKRSVIVAALLLLLSEAVSAEVLSVPFAAGGGEVGYVLCTGDVPVSGEARSLAVDCVVWAPSVLAVSITKTGQSSPIAVESSSLGRGMVRDRLVSTPFRTTLRWGAGETLPQFALTATASDEGENRPLAVFEVRSVDGSVSTGAKLFLRAPNNQVGPVAIASLQ